MTVKKLEKLRSSFFLSGVAFFRFVILACTLILTSLTCFPHVSHAGDFRESLFAVYINSEKVSDGAIFLVPDDNSDHIYGNISYGLPGEVSGEVAEEKNAKHFYASADDLKLWRLDLPSTAKGVDYSGVIYYPLSVFSGLQVTLDRPNQALLVTAQVENYEGTTFDFQPKRKTSKGTSETGFFLNYDFLLQGEEGIDESFNSLFEGVFFSPGGVFINTFREREVENEYEFIRLASTYQYDYVNRRSSLKVGDAFSIGGRMGGRVNFGGIQYSTNFSLQPDFIKYPKLSAIGGVAESKSTIDIYVDNVKRMSRQVQPGPFEIHNIPAVTGKGEVMIVVKDFLGRETLIREPFYINPTILKKGLSDYSYEAGFERLNYGEESAEYGRLVAAGTHRYGLKNNLTGELHLESMHKKQMTSLDLIALFPSLGIVSSGFGLSRNEDIYGSAWNLGYNFQSKKINCGLAFKTASKHFSTVSSGTAPGIKFEASFRAGFFSRRLGGGGLSFLYREDWLNVKTRILTGRYGINALSGKVHLTAFKSMDDDSYGASLYYMFHFGKNKNAKFGVETQSGKHLAAVDVSKSLPMSNSGFSWKIGAEARDDGYNSFRGNVSRYGQWNKISLDLAGRDGNDSYRVGMSGAVALLRQGFFVSRRINQSLALADTSGVSGVHIHQRNKELGTTNEEGYLLVPGLRPYEENRLELKVDTLPIDLEIKDDGVKFVTPRYRSAVMASFGIKKTQSILFTATMADGTYLPAQTTISDVNKAREWFVAKNGLIYLNDVPVGKITLIAEIEGKQYELVIDIPLTSDDVPSLGTFVFSRQ